MKRRRFITLIGSTLASITFKNFAQGSSRVRRIGMLSPLAENDPGTAATNAAFEQALNAFGWTAGRNIQIFYRYAGGDFESIRKYARELVELDPDVIIGRSTPAVKALLEVTKTIPIIFTQVTDAERQGFVSSLSHPGGNVTGFTHFEPSIGGKWLELLRDFRPNIKRVAVTYNPTAAPFAELYLGSIEKAAQTFGVAPVILPFNDPNQFSRDVEYFAREPNGSLIVVPDAITGTHRGTIIAAAAKHRLPAIYGFRFYTADGGLMSYGPDPVAAYRQAASYVDEVFKGKKAGDLPVQAPTRFQLIINLETAKSIGLEIPMPLQQLADEVIE